MPSIDQIYEWNQLARQKTWAEIDEGAGLEFCVDAHAYDVDDAYIAGTNDGRIYMARDILDALGVKWRQE